MESGLDNHADVSSAEDANDGDYLLFGVALADIITFLGLCLTVALAFTANKKIPRTEGVVFKFHGIFLAVALVTTIIAPRELRESLFSPFDVMVVGTIYPIYESVYAICTIEESDDTLWLQYWIVQAAISFSTEWIDDLKPSQFQQRWFEFQFFFYLWLCLPWTDGATLIHHYVTAPFLAPVVTPVVAKASDWINKAILMIMNASHLWALWLVFEIFPASWKRFVWIAIAVAYPLASSLVAVVTPEGADDTFWLTYWSCFGTLFLVVDLVENYLGWIPGFYSVAIFSTVYLMLPMFNGAEKMFRHVLVPLVGLQEMLIRKDAEGIKNEAMKHIPEDRREGVLKEIALSFSSYQSIPVV